MYLFVSIILSLILAYVLFIFGPYGAVIGIGIVLGCLFRGLYLLHDIHRKITKLVPDHDKVKEVYENYLQEREKTLS